MNYDPVAEHQSRQSYRRFFAVVVGMLSGLSFLTLVIVIGYFLVGDYTEAPVSYYLLKYVALSSLISGFLLAAFCSALGGIADNADALFYIQESIRKANEPPPEKKSYLK